jgi:methylamine dehydrogenase accessory protein MauD
VTLWTLSYIVLWIAVLCLTFGLIVLYRQVGLLHLRFGPRGALALAGDGPDIGRHVRNRVLVAVDGSTQGLHTDASDTLLVFLSPGCGICKTVVPAIRAFSKSNPVRVLVTVIGTAREAAEYGKGLARIPVFANSELADDLNVTNPPYGVIVSRGGVIDAKGVVNSLEHLDELYEQGLARHHGDSSQPARPAASLARTESEPSARPEQYTAGAAGDSQAHP